MTFDELKEILEKKFQIVRLADIARELSVTPQVVSNWKSRNQIPYKYIKIVQKKIKDIEKNGKKKALSGQTVFLDYSTLENNNVDDDSFIDLILDVYEKIREKYISILITTSIFFLLSILYSFVIAHPVFRSNAKVLPKVNNNSGGSMSGIASNFGINIPSKNKDFISPAIYPDIIYSKKLLKNVLAQKFLTNKYKEKLPLINILNDDPNTKRLWSDVEHTSSAKKLKDAISVGSSRKTPIITIYASAFEAELAASMVNILIVELNKLLGEYSEDRNKEKLNFIKIRISQVEIELKKAEEILKKFRERNRNIDTSPGLLIELNRIIRDVDVQTEIFTTLKTELELAKIDQIEENNILMVLDAPEPSIYRESPKPLKNMILSTMMGLCISIIYFYVGSLYYSNIKKIK